MKSTTMAAALLLALPLTACTTTAEDVNNAERTANEKTEAAYNKADEKALAAQDQAEQKTIHAVDEADRKIDAAQRKAEADTDHAYKAADRVEAKQDRKVEETRQKQFVSEMSNRLSRRKKDIKAFEQKISKEGNSDKARDEPQLATLRDAQHNAEDKLNKVKKADWREWATYKPATQDAFAHLDDSLSSAQAR